VPFHREVLSETTKYIEQLTSADDEFSPLRDPNVMPQQKPTKLMIADFFTKPLHGERFVWLRNIIMGADEVSEQHEAMEVAEPREMRGAELGVRVQGTLGCLNYSVCTDACLCIYVLYC
jgi:hypothetical protein